MREDANAQNVVYEEKGVLRSNTFGCTMATANEIVFGPEDIFVCHTATDNDQHFERILRVLIRVPNRRVESWAVFRPEREWQDDHGEPVETPCVLRHSTWDIKADRLSEPWKSGKGPTVFTKTRHVAEDHCRALAQQFTHLDSILVSGVQIETSSRSYDEIKWQEISIYRAFDWGVTDMTWHFSRRNLQAELAAFDLARSIEETIDKGPHGSVWKMTMPYPPSPYLHIK